MSNTYTEKKSAVELCIITDSPSKYQKHEQTGAISSPRLFTLLVSTNPVSHS